MRGSTSPARLQAGRCRCRRRQPLRPLLRARHRLRARSCAGARRANGLGDGNEDSLARHGSHPTNTRRQSRQDVLGAHAGAAPSRPIVSGGSTRASIVSGVMSMARAGRRTPAPTRRPDPTFLCWVRAVDDPPRRARGGGAASRPGGPGEELTLKSDRNRAQPAVEAFQPADVEESRSRPGWSWKGLMPAGRTVRTEQRTGLPSPERSVRCAPFLSTPVGIPYDALTSPLRANHSVPIGPRGDRSPRASADLLEETLGDSVEYVSFVVRIASGRRRRISASEPPPRGSRRARCPPCRAGAASP